MKNKLDELENLANGIESNVYTSCVINIFPKDAENLRWAIDTIKEYKQFKDAVDKHYKYTHLSAIKSLAEKEEIQRIVREYEESTHPETAAIISYLKNIL